MWVRERNWNKQSSEEKRLNRVTTVVVLCSGAGKEESKVPTLVQFSASALGPATDEGFFPHHMLQVQVMGFRVRPSNGQFQTSAPQSALPISLHSHDHVTLSFCSPILSQQQPTKTGAASSHPAAVPQSHGEISASLPQGACEVSKTGD